MTMNLDALLDVTLDDLADLPSFQPFPAGAHRCLATFGTKEIKGKDAVTLDLKLIETLEYAEPLTEEELEAGKGTKEGDESSTMFMLDNEFGPGHLKKCALPFCAALQLSTIREVVEQVQSVEVVVITSLRADKNDKDKFYLNIKEIEVA